MSSSTFIPLARRWLPLLVLLVALAQLATAAHQHEDEHRLVDCVPCLQHAGLKYLHSGYSLPLVPVTASILPAPIQIHTAPALPRSGTQPIRAPPVCTLPFIA